MERPSILMFKYSWAQILGPNKGVLYWPKINGTGQMCNQIDHASDCFSVCNF